jgi:hypothetical protein
MEICWVCGLGRRLTLMVYLTGIDELACNWCLSPRPPQCVNLTRRVIALAEFDAGRWQKAGKPHTRVPTKAATAMRGARLVAGQGGARRAPGQENRGT